MKAKSRHQFNRRAFLRGAGGISIGLPFLESLPGRSAWAQSDSPVFTFFIMQQNGVIRDKWWPTQTGALSAATMNGTAVAPLADYAANMLILRGIRAPGGNPGACGHAQGCVQAITGVVPSGTGQSSSASGPSADWVISQALNPMNTDGLNLYAGSQTAYINERMSFRGANDVRTAQNNPYQTYQRLVGVGTVGEGGGTGGGGTTDPPITDDLLIRRRSVNDQVLAEFNYLVNLPQIGAEDKRRLENHMAGIRQLEENLMATGGMMNEINDGTGEFYGCNILPSSMTALDAFANGVQFNTQSHMIEDLAALHGETVALTFACGANRTAALQWGSGTDGTVYQTNATGNYNTFHKISHQTDSDSANGNDSFAAQAHAEIDIIRNTTFAKILESFKNYGLFDKSVIMYTNSIDDGRNHTFIDLPIIVAGDGGGKFKQGQSLTISGGKTNAQLLCSIINAAGHPIDNFGAGGGQLTDIHV